MDKNNELSTQKSSEIKRKAKSDKPDIPSGLSYVVATGVLGKILTKIIEAPAPDKVTQDFLSNVWGFTGGSAMAVIPFLKKIDFLSSDGTPTDHYRNFRTASHRNSAIRHGLRAGFPDIYKQTDFAEKAKDEKISDIIIALTGRSKNDQVIRAIHGSFKALADFMNTENDAAAPATQESAVLSETFKDTTSQTASSTGFNLGYQINIILPETKDVEVFDAIFRKLKEHLL